MRKKSELSCDSAIATKKRGRDKRLRVIERGFQSEEEAESDF